MTDFAMTPPDDRVRRNIYPVRIVAAGGDVRHPEYLLRETSLQIGLTEPVLACLHNGEEGEEAWILLDFGRELQGGIRLLSGASPDPLPADVRITFGESVSEALSVPGERGACNDHSPRDFTVKLPILSDLTFGETGFRFVKLTLLGRNRTWMPKAAPALFVYRDIEYKGSFVCSDPLINRIYDTAAYTCHLCMQNMLWDGIKRDRLVWIGDTHPEMLTVKTVFGADRCITENLRFARDEAPLPGWMNTMAAYSLWWLIITRDWAYYTGDDSFVLESRDYISGLTAQICGLVTGEGDHDVPGNFLDWPTCGKPEAKAGIHGLLILALEAAQTLCRRLGDGKGVALCGEKLSALRSVCPDGGEYSQTNAMLLLSGVGGERELNRILDRGASGMSAYMSCYILSALAGAGRTEEALAMMKEYYGGMLSVGATTFWEDFDPAWLRDAGRIDELPEEGKKDIHGDYGKFCYTGFRHSLCHGWSSGVTAFLAENVLGVRLGEGGRTFSVTPHLGSLTFAEGSVPTPGGVIRVRVERINGRDEVTVLHKPENTGIIS